jgi:Zn ribbon nucleic-acid-binding protein
MGMNEEERKFCPVCEKQAEVILVRKPDIDLKLCKNCGNAVSVLYKDS